MNDKTTANIKIKGGEYSYVHLYGLNNFAPQVFDMTDSNNAVQVSDNTIIYEMEPETVSLLVIAKDKDSIPKNNAADAKEQKSSETEGKKKNSSKGKTTAVSIGIAGAALLGAAFGVFRAKKKK